MDEAATELLEQYTARKKGKRALPHEIPDVIRKEDLTPETIDVLTHFGLDATHFLNVYSRRVEDALIEVAQKTKEYREMCLELKDEVLRLRELVPEDVANTEQVC